MLIFCCLLFQFTLLALVSTVPGSAGVRLEDAQIFEGQKDRPVILDAVSRHFGSGTRLLAPPKRPRVSALTAVCFVFFFLFLCVTRATFRAKLR